MKRMKILSNNKQQIAGASINRVLVNHILNDIQWRREYKFYLFKIKITTKEVKMIPNTSIFFEQRVSFLRDRRIPKFRL